MMSGGVDGGRPAKDGVAQAARPAAESGADPLRQAMRRVESVALLAGAREIEIEHRGELYRLRCTNKGKLILTK